MMVVLTTVVKVVELCSTVLLNDEIVSVEKTAGGTNVVELDVLELEDEDNDPESETEEENCVLSDP